ncbi:gamma-glutamylcyclotransferase-like [Uloborus diversus]|uniref:gamma-glutamylcyclotransferase-like n=1 Tax=Uloborus diversus TaxID=327109 RepID=UPI00240A4CC9|nr:gamma-glutamylcyclotransferase-like [Uloborus diversus]
MTFLYFAYASNLFTKRMRLNCPSAKPKCVAELKNFRFAFIEYADLWKGGCATIVEDDVDSVWGVVWEISKEHEEALNKQEVGYTPIHVKVYKDNVELPCKTYQRPPCIGISKPSLIYKTVFVRGAKEHGLPEWYIKKLEAIEDNGYVGPVGVPVDIEV